MSIYLVRSHFALRKAKVCRNMYANLKSVVCFLKILSKFLLFRPFNTVYELPTKKSGCGEEKLDRKSAGVWTVRNPCYCSKSTKRARVDWFLL